MQQSEFQQIREWYQQFEDAVLFYAIIILHISEQGNKKSDNFVLFSIFVHFA